MIDRAPMVDPTIYSPVDILFAFLLACPVVLAAIAWADQRAVPVPIETILQIRSPGEGSPTAFSPDGKWLAYTVRNAQRLEPAEDEEFLRSGTPWFGFGSKLLITNVSTLETKNLNAGGGDWLPEWSPNARYLAFVSNRGVGGQARLWMWDSEDDVVRQLGQVAVRMDGWEHIEWLPDSRSVLVAAIPDGLCVAECSDKVRVYERQAKNSSGYVDSSSTTTLYKGTAQADAAQAGTFGLNRFLRDLMLVDVLTGKATTILRGKRIASFHVSEGGARVVYSSPQRFEKAGSQQILFDLAVVELRTMQERRVVHEARLNLAGGFSISPDGSRLSFRSDGTLDKAEDIYVVRVEGGLPDNLTHFENANQTALTPYSVVPLWDADGKTVFYIKNGGLWTTSLSDQHTQQVVRIEGRKITHLVAISDHQLLTEANGTSTIVMAHDDSNGQDGFYKVNWVSGVATKLLEKGESYSTRSLPEGRSVAALKNGEKLALFREDAQHPPDLWVANAGFSDLRRITKLNPQLDQYEMGAARLLDWLDDDGERLHGALLLPSGYEAGKRYPLIVFVYGGVRLSNATNKFGGYMGTIPYYNLQLLATRGYAVLMPDAPQHLGTPMLDLAKSVLPGVNKCVELGIADPSRLGVMGHSYGGYSALSLLVMTKRFKAAIEADGFADLAGFYGEMDTDGSAFGTSAETGQELVGGTPWEYRDRYIENSPIFYLDRVETPLLIIHGAEDRTIAPFLGDQLFVGLRRLGKSVEYAKYGREDHVLTSYANQIDVCARMIAWFDEHLGRALP